MKIAKFNLKKKAKNTNKEPKKKVVRRGTEAGRAVARDVLAAVSNGEIPNKKEIQMRHGYSARSARSMKGTTNETYKNEMFDIVQALEEERKAIIKRLKITRNTAKYHHLVDGLDKVTKNIQLLSGKETERIGLIDDIYNRL